MRGLERGVIRLGCTEGFAVDLMPEVIGTFRERHPGILFDMRVAAPQAVTRLVREGEVDLGVTFGFVPDPSVRIELVGNAPLMALMASDHPLAGQDHVTLRDIAAHAVALPAPDTTARQLFDLACGAEGVAVEPVLSTNYMSALWRFAEIGGGITVTGRITVLSRIWRFQIVALPVRSPTVEKRRYEVQSMIGRSLPDAARVFLDHLKLCLSRMEHGEAMPAGELSWARSDI
ncbi:hypothetical protein GCM10007301_05580 [Azorhizobium oxalatiphilum]|uniref:LysR substrate-binding domain-containing protein n=1 Tax=Azorhizobium oxalatiphilum TaxID=980631 RepID=A0A917BLL5_9HYPH|nr:hypothetical protein GCM10007301_05580 [Azorhizobium oxalatiphilum]